MPGGGGVPEGGCVPGECGGGGGGVPGGVVCVPRGEGGLDPGGWYPSMH